MQTESQKSQLRSQPGMTEVFFDGGSVIVPVEQEQHYREALAVKCINGYKVYVKDNDVHIDMGNEEDETDLETLESILIEQNHKIYAMAGRLYL